MIIFFVGLCFLTAVLEIDVFGYDHTFFDSCDSYVQPLNKEVHIDFKEIKKIAAPTLQFGDQAFTCFSACENLNEGFVSIFFHEISSERKRYLKTRTLLI